MLTPDIQNRFSEWRRKAAEGTITREEMKEAILALRGSRRTASESTPSKSRSSKGPARSADDMLGELGSL